MIDLLLQSALALAGSLVAGWTAAYVIVAVADGLGLVYSSDREARRHRDDDMHDPAGFEWRLAPVTAWRLDLDDPLIQRALAAPPRSRSPIRDRMLALIAASDGAAS